MSRTIALIGMMGAGKTTIARRLAKRLSRIAVDTDAEIERHTGRRIPEIFATEGEGAFRLLEHEVVRELAKHPDLVVSLGGGAVLADANVAELLLTGVLVELRASPEVLIERLKRSANDRPLLAGDLEARVRETHAARADRYAAVADHTVDASQTPDQVVEDIIEWAMQAGDVLTPSEHEQVMP